MVASASTALTSPSRPRLNTRESLARDLVGFRIKLTDLLELEKGLYYSYRSPLLYTKLLIADETLDDPHSPSLDDSGATRAQLGNKSNVVLRCRV